MNQSGYAQQILIRRFGRAFRPEQIIDYGGQLSDESIQPRIDGVISNLVAVEIQTGWAKSARGAILDLINSGYPLKLLVIVAPSDRDYFEKIRRHCTAILAMYLPQESFRVVLLAGNAGAPQIDADGAEVIRALLDLGLDIDAER